MANMNQPFVPLNQPALSKEQYVALLRERGKHLFTDGKNEEEKRRGYRMLEEAAREQDPEAMFFVASIQLLGLGDDITEAERKRAMRTMQRLSRKGNMMARAFLSTYCNTYYDQTVNRDRKGNTVEGPLVDFDGKRIRIKRKGLLTPVDAVLTYENGKNVLALTADIAFFYMDQLPNQAEFENAVMTGMRDWQGEYEVFGGQKLSVRVNLTSNLNLFDVVIVAPVTQMFSQWLSKFCSLLPKENRKEFADLIESRRSFVWSAGRWSATKKQLVCMQSENGRFDEYDALRHVAKHEFGHLLGLGDLYRCESDGLEGVAEGQYAELDSYATGNRDYYSVMCDHYGPITNNDIEMVVLAFRDNRKQLFQPYGTRKRQKISKALGRGN